LIIVVLVAVQWVVQQNYHRQVVFLPGFTRLKAGSLLTKPSSVLTREPSTVDAPTPSGINKPSSVKG
jgi:hypothetical protein